MARNSRHQAPISIMKSVKFDFLTILKSLSIDQFTVDDLTKAYLGSPGSVHSSKKAARQFVYRNMQRLIASGDMDRLKVVNSWPVYMLTEQFHKRNSSTKGRALETTPKADSSQHLKERLNQYKLEMLTAMGEAEEYGAIYVTLPHLKDDVQPLYNESRDRCSKLLGRVKALESLLSMTSR
jgi:hypothetical protein